MFRALVWVGRQSAIVLVIRVNEKVMFFLELVGWKAECHSPVIN